MCNVAKTFEWVVYNQLKLSLTSQLSKQQHGFVTNRCIETILMEFSNYVHNNCPQTICGPFLFLLFFNDSDKECGLTKVFKFADDKTLLKTNLTHAFYKHRSTNLQIGVLRIILNLT